MLDQRFSIQGSGEVSEVDVDVVRRNRQALQRRPPFARREHAAVGVFIGDFRSEPGIAEQVLLNLWFRAASAGIFDGREGLGHATEQLEQGRSVERFNVSTSQGQRLIDWLPAN